MDSQRLRHLAILTTGVVSFMAGLVGVGVVVHRLVNAVLLAGILSFVLTVLVLGSVYMLVVYSPPRGRVAIYRRGDHLQWVPPQEVVWVIPFLWRIAREIPLHTWDVPVGVNSATTRDEVQVRCLVYVRCRLAPHELNVAPGTFMGFNEENWQRQIQQIVHDTLLRCVRDKRWRDVRDREGLEALEQEILAQAQPALATLGVIAETLYWHYFEPLPAVWDTLEQVQEATVEGEALYRRLRELSRRFRIRPHTMNELFLLALTAALGREGEGGPTIQLSLQLPPDEAEPKH